MSHGAGVDGGATKARWRVEKFFDVRIECKDGDVFAHRERLADDSDVFDTMLSGPFAEGKDSEDGMVHVSCPHITVADMTTVLKFMYGRDDCVTRYERTTAVIKELDYRQSDVGVTTGVGGSGSE